MPVLRQDIDDLLAKVLITETLCGLVNDDGKHAIREEATDLDAAWKCMEQVMRDDRSRFLVGKARAPLIMTGESATNLNENDGLAAPNLCEPFI